MTTLKQSQRARGGAALPTRPTASLFLALNLAAWLLYLATLNNASLRQLNLDDQVISALENVDIVKQRESTAMKPMALYNRLVKRGVPPVSCAKVLKDARTNVTQDVNGGKLYTRYTSQEPHFFISLHNRNYDKVRFDVFETTGYYYEQVLTDCFRQVLHESQQANNTTTRPRVLDVGGNIGWFSLLSASMGAQVATFEPHPPNYLRMCESLCLNNWLHTDINIKNKNHNETSCLAGSYDTPKYSDRITIFPYGVAEQDKQMFFLQMNSNPGQGQVLENTTKLPKEVVATPLRCATLDSMVEALGWNTGNIDILKVDVEGAEMNVFLGAKQLLKSNHVLNIFMEGNVRRENEKKEFRRMVKLFMDSGYHIYKIGGFSGPSSTTDVPNLNDSFVDNLVAACGNNSAKQCNLWWKTKQSLVSSSTV